MSASGDAASGDAYWGRDELSHPHEVFFLFFFYWRALKHGGFCLPLFGAFLVSLYLPMDASMDLPRYFSIYLYIYAAEEARRWFQV
jgi:hypothetical protein